MKPTSTASPAPLSGEQKADLQQKAQAATPGPWMPAPTAPDNKFRVYPQYPNYGNPKPLFEPSNHICTMNRENRRVPAQLLADARFIASAHPAAILSLLEEIADQAKQITGLKSDILDILRDMRLPLVPAPAGEEMEDHGTKCYRQGQNDERFLANLYCRQKAYEYSPEGIGPDPVKEGEWDTLAAAPAGVQKGGGADA